MEIGGKSGSKQGKDRGKDREGSTKYELHLIHRCIQAAPPDWLWHERVTGDERGDCILDR